ncbi:uncharacterized protein LOC142025119 isoform X2 [Carettochelys insculpta]|uniref:uncharacterized protein LOC142025119 isoform X2 n=1 Tax=Carettochelys insculpta TaxID=44489 RepID=UPI003EBFDDAC
MDRRGEGKEGRKPERDGRTEGQTGRQRPAQVGWSTDGKTGGKKPAQVSWRGERWTEKRTGQRPARRTDRRTPAQQLGGQRAGWTGSQAGGQPGGRTDGHQSSSLEDGGLDGRAARPEASPEDGQTDTSPAAWWTEGQMDGQPGQRPARRTDRRTPAQQLGGRRARWTGSQARGQPGGRTDRHQPSSLVDGGPDGRAARPEASPEDGQTDTSPARPEASPEAQRGRGSRVMGGLDLTRWWHCGKVEANGPAVPHRLAYHYVGTYDAGGLLEFGAAGLLDGAPLDGYNRTTRAKVPAQPWVGAGLDPEYWRRGGASRAAKEDWFRRNVETLKQRTNQTQGRHTLQWSLGCELEPGGLVRGWYQLGYDGEDFVVFDGGNRRWLAAAPWAEATGRRWDAQPEFARQLHSYLGDTCVEWLGRFLRSRRAWVRSAAPETPSAEGVSPGVVAGATLGALGGLAGAGALLLWGRRARRPLRCSRLDLITENEEPEGS